MKIPPNTPREIAWRAAVSTAPKNTALGRAFANYRELSKLTYRTLNEALGIPDKKARRRAEALATRKPKP